MAIPTTGVARTQINPRALFSIDGLLTTGMRLGPMGKRAAINKVLQLLPQWKRGDCWRRIRQLRKSQRCSVEGQGVQSRIRQQCEAVEMLRRPSPTRRWTALEDQQLFNWAGYEPVNRIAQRLDRSARAIRFRLGALGMSAKVTDGWSQRALMRLLRISPARFRNLVGRGLLKVRDSRVTGSSITAYRNGRGQPPELIAPTTGGTAYSWDMAADLLDLTVGQIQGLISAGKLKMLDTFVTDRSFEEFCRRHGSEMNMALIDPAITKWLISDYGALLGKGSNPIPRAQKHALVVRTCRCGRKIAGNVFFKHVKHCWALKDPKEHESPAAISRMPLPKACSTEAAQAKNPTPQAFRPFGV